MSADFLYEVKKFLRITEEDCVNMIAMGPTLIAQVDAITDAFYAHLSSQESTKKFLPDEATINRLKATHKRWFGELFTGIYDEAYYANRVRIGMAHVRVGIHPEYVDGIMSQIEQDGVSLIIASFPADVAGKYTRSLLKVLDLDLLIINKSYEEERLARLVEGTGLTRNLLEAFINQPR